MPEMKMLIGGALVAGDMTMDVINPATGEAFLTVPRASVAQADAAIAAAKAAQPAWGATPLATRQQVLLDLADAIGARADEFARLLTQEQGKPLPEAQGEVAWTQGFLRHYATLGLEDRVIQDDAAGHIVVKHRPLGVVVGIIAWNFPLLVALWKIGPATLAGNAIVLKPAPTTPASALLLGEICAQVFPAGVVNVITDANDLGPHLTAHPDVAKIGFTGSTATGKRIAANGADTLKRVTLELGGNDPAIVLDDVDVRETAKAIFANAFLNCGQVCLAIKRAYVHADIYDAMAAELARLAQEAVVGDGLEQGTQIGPIQNAMQFDKIKGFLDSARADGVIIAGGAAMERAGYFIAPTIVRDVTDGMKIVDEEQFGPILPLVKFDDVEDVIARANASDYGLGGSVWSADVGRAADIAARIDSGQVWVNQHLAIGPHIPMAGFKQSGLGVEQGVEGLAEYAQVQVVNIKR
ncbi:MULTISPECIES: aldehyde dehydrogenase family protein [unclassified Novosphingobium]|uniref:aldehyde dehydrogenase family protein n=1 Tax=unclassified Novosphingobium TaxID=2644732 RepID=UPI00146F6F56|nr:MULTISPECIES: aldehyde dehydrogenase family protein [unclassified Novosphingobium]NMN04877.1 acyl-CoA reductase-like NAD-dependent aldehyde dehydrogenase [Novosphingobium sp. SG919]NMN87170.1 acyl-CoA reductase-like NAD-dependent aldehyde dehydrogenase [Novosphingobium sp. SG916]